MEQVPLDLLKPAAINDRIYRPVALDDPSIIELAKDMQAKGVLEVLVVTLDNVIVSGHRRRSRATVGAGSPVPSTGWLGCRPGGGGGASRNVATGHRTGPGAGRGSGDRTDTGPQRHRLTFGDRLTPG